VKEGLRKEKPYCGKTRKWGLGPRVTSYSQPMALIPPEASPHKRRLKSDTISVQEADKTFITSDGTSPYNSTRKWAVKRNYREDNNQHPHNDINYEKGVIRVLHHTELPAGDPYPQARLGAGRNLYSTSSGTKSGSSSVKIKNGVSTNVLNKSNLTYGGGINRI
jgi:hypothetical protein